ncbi:MAG: hypothetical protein ACHQK8_09740 [Bacteroidia bacterium]
MKNITLFFRKYFPTPGKKLLLFIFILNFTSYNLWRDWRGNSHPFISDSDQYYSYIIATFIHHDLGFHFKSKFWLMQSPEGGKVPKVSMGLAYIMLPFFLVADGVAYLTGAPNDGYSAPYAFGIYYGTILIVFLGLIFLRKILLRWFSENVTAWTVASIYFGTNLFYYTLGWNTLTHSYLFTLFVFFIYLTIRWYETFRLKHLVWMGLVFGLITLIRPTEIVLVFIFVLWGIGNFADMKLRILLFYSKKFQLILCGLLVLVPWMPQMLYWKYYTNQFFFYSYGNEGFYYFHPQFLNVLLSYRKGWLVYTPIMIFSLAGFFFLRKRCKDSFAGITVTFLITFYLISAWWAWWWGGCFGMRALVHHYAYLAFPMAACYDFILNRFKKIIIYFVISVMMFYSLYCSYRYKSLVIHWDSMTKEAFWFGFFKVRWSSREESKEFEKMLEEPDYSKRGEKF